MLTYIIRRFLYAIPILIGVNLITFLLFFSVNTPDDMARMQLGAKQTTPEMISNWKRDKGYDKPLFFNVKSYGFNKILDTLFVQETVKLFLFDFGHSDSGRDIMTDIKQRMLPSLAIAIPTLAIGLLVNITVALLLTLFRYSRLDFVVMVFAVVVMSVSGLFYIIFAQLLLSSIWHWFPISGYMSGWEGIKFLVLPVLIGVFAGLGSGIRWYRSIFLEEINKDYVRTAWAKGNSDIRVLFKHILPNGILPILTGVVVLIPTLFMGSLIMESFFGIPGLGSYTIDAISSQDFSIVKAMVYLGSVLYIFGLILTDMSYALFDPRVSLS